MRALAAALAAWLLSASALQQNAPALMTMSGTVRDANSGRPLASARVHLISADSGALASIATGDDGTFAFDSVGPGAYFVVAAKPPYAPRSFPVEVDAEPARPIRVVNRDVTGLEIGLMPGAIITGRILDPFGRPAAGVGIEVRMVGAANQRRYYSLPSWLPQWTDERGEYRLSGLAAGDYLIFSRAQGSTAARVGSATGPSAEAPAVFFPDTIDAALAELVRVEPGQERSGVDLRLRLSPLYRVAGVSNLAPTQYAFTQLKPFRPDLAELSLQWLGNSAGGLSYLFTSVPPGHYWLLSRIDAGQKRNPDGSTQPSPAMWAASEVMVQNADISGMSLTYQVASSVAGRIVAAAQGSSAALSLTGRLRVQLVPMEGTPPVFYEHWSNGVAAGADGTFTLPAAVQGGHQIRVRMNGEDLIVLSITVNGVTTPGATLDVPSGNLKDIVITVTVR